MEQQMNVESERVVAAFELQQSIVDYCRELDRGGLNAADFFTEYGIVDIGRMSIRGHAAMRAFYQQLAEHVRHETPGGVRTSRHACTNLHVSFHSREQATVTGLVANYSGAGHAPVMNATIPTIVSDVRFECRRQGRAWRICGLYGGPVFVGNDPVQNKALVG